MNITISIRRDGAGAITTTQDNYNRLTAATLPGCPFKNYNAWDLLQDLIRMYSWKLTPGHAYHISDFLTICNDAHAEAYRAALEEIKRRYEAQDGPTRPETVTDEETPTDTRKAPEEASQDAPTARQTAGTNAAEETPTEATKARQEASQDATPATAAGAKESTPGGPTTAATIAADTRTAGATKATPQGQERATAAGEIAARIKNANKAGHACENAPGRTETPQAVQTTTTPHKRPHRGKTRAGPSTDGSQGQPRKARFFDSMQKSGQKNGATGRDPFYSRKIRFSDQELTGNFRKLDPTRVQNILQ